MSQGETEQHSPLHRFYLKKKTNQLIRYNSLWVGLLVVGLVLSSRIYVALRQ